MTDDPMDQPEGDRYFLAVPFVACQSQGGPYDDDAFVAGFQCGEIDRSLTVAAVVGAAVVTFTVRSEEVMVRQLDLIAMNRGFKVAVDQDEDVPEWAQATFTRSEA